MSTSARTNSSRNRRRISRGVAAPVKPTRSSTAHTIRLSQTTPLWNLWKCDFDAVQRRSWRRGARCAGSHNFIFTSVWQSSGITGVREHMKIVWWFLLVLVQAAHIFSHNKSRQTFLVMACSICFTSNICYLLHRHGHLSVQLQAGFAARQTVYVLGLFLHLTQPLLLKNISTWLHIIITAGDFFPENIVE